MDDGQGTGTQGNGANEEIERILAEFVECNGCSYLSDLPQLFQTGALLFKDASVRRIGLSAWSTVLTYFSGAPTTVDCYDEVERALGL